MEIYSGYNQLNRYREANGRVRVAIYARCSSDEQKKHGYTIADQLKFGYLFAKENDLIVTGEYIDEGVSATLEIQKRKALAQLIEDAKEGKFDIIIVKCIDRFFRSVEEYYMAQKQLRQAGVAWLSIEEPDLDAEDPDASFKINISLTLAEFEAKKTSKRILFNNKMRIQNKQVVTGDHNFHFPWMVVGEKRNKRLAKNPEKVDMLYDLLDHFETHQSKSATLKYFNTKYGTEIHMKTLDSLLRDTLLYGEYKGVADYVEPYITQERFGRIQDILKQNSRYSPRTGRVFLFAGIIKCRCCGRNMVANTSMRNFVRTGKRLTITYRCNKNRLDKACINNQAPSEHILEKQLLDNLEKYITDEIIRVEEIQANPDPVVVDNTKKISSVKDEMNRLNTMFRKGRLNESDYDKEYAILERELNELEAMEKPVERDLDALKELLNSDFRTIYNALDREHRKAFWRKIIKEFTLDENKKVIPESIIFF